MKRYLFTIATAVVCITLPTPAVSADFIECDRATGDITGAGHPFTVILLGESFDATSAFMKSIRLRIENADGTPLLAMTLPRDGGTGYEPALTLRDITGDSVPDIFIGASTGGSGGIYSYLIYTMRDGAPVELLNTARDTVTTFSGAFADGFLATLTITMPGGGSVPRAFTLDLSRKAADYIASGIYTAGGALTREVTLWGGGFSQLTPEDTDGDGRLELVGIQVVHGYMNPDQVAWVVPIFAWEDELWRVRDVAVLPVGGTVVVGR